MIMKLRLKKWRFLMGLLLFMRELEVVQLDGNNGEID
jgi:hypothetical protein